MPGAGKSTLGRLLALALGRTFVDLDQVIEEQMNMSIPRIFSELGESQFRIAEKRALDFVMNERNQVVSTGGGTPCFFNNMERMRSDGYTVFIDPPMDVLIERLKKDYKDRPKLADSPSLADVLERTYRDRLPHYRKSEITFNTADQNPDELVALLEGETNR